MESAPAETNLVDDDAPRAQLREPARIRSSDRRHNFDYRDYDERSDVLYLHVGPPNGPAAKTLETPEGHTFEYDDHGAIIGLEFMGVRAMLDRNEELQLTWPPAHLAAKGTFTARGEATVGTVMGFVLR